MGTRPFIGVEAIGAQVRRHHLLDQCLKAQVVFSHTSGLMYPLQGNGGVTHPGPAGACLSPTSPGGVPGRSLGALIAT